MRVLLRAGADPTRRCARGLTAAQHASELGTPPPELVELLKPRVVVGVGAFAEDRLREALERGVVQYVVLGAGYDTFAYRQPPGTSHLRVVEVDQPATQAAKLASLRDAAIAIPSNVTHAAIDFEHTSLREGLAQHGVAIDAPTFFSWLGVTMYLTREVVADTLGTLAAFPSGSEVVFTLQRCARRGSAR